LFDLQGKSFDLTAILIEILRRLDFRISQLTTHPRLALSEANRHNMLTGRTVTLQLADQTVTGICIGIDDEGQLVLQTEEKLHRCSSGIVLRW
jgi:biotin-(acetyl-CoA carboxylase) ligase